MLADLIKRLSYSFSTLELLNPFACTRAPLRPDPKILLPMHCSHFSSPIEMTTILILSYCLVYLLGLLEKDAPYQWRMA